MGRHPSCAGSLLLLALAWRPCCAAVQPAALFCDHLVLQRGQAVPVWGTAQPGEEITVSFRDQVRRATAAADGTWKAVLEPLVAGGPDTLTIAGSDSVRVQDVLVGEVWLGAGQSNMAVGAGGVAGKGDEALAAQLAHDHPLVRVHGEGASAWRVATVAAGPGLPALAYSFAVTLQERLGVPVGIIVRAKPGTSTDFWVDERALAADPACSAAIAAYARDEFPALQRAYAERLAQWRAAPAGRKEPSPPTPPGQPVKGAERLGRHYQDLIRPLMPFAIRGILWDQGENHATLPGPSQFAVMGALVRGWRADWGLGELPFVYLQKPSGGGCAWDPAAPLTALAAPFAPLPDQVPATGAGLHRDTYVRLQSIPGTGMAPTSDLGGGMHPLRKSSYAQRAARVALGLAYGEPGITQGPTYAGHALEGGRVRIRFANTGAGLVARHAERLQGFLVADAGRRFVWADAVIDGATVVVSHPQVAAPVAVRYAWADEIPWANLFNADGLPAQAFRTDDW